MTNERNNFPFYVQLVLFVVKRYHLSNRCYKSDFLFYFDTILGYCSFVNKHKSSQFKNKSVLYLSRPNQGRSNPILYRVVICYLLKIANGMICLRRPVIDKGPIDKHMPALHSLKSFISTCLQISDDIVMTIILIIERKMKIRNRSSEI